jgi:ADP-heptose:LPS heptosyltransferase
MRWSISSTVDWFNTIVNRSIWKAGTWLRSKPSKHLALCIIRIDLIGDAILFTPALTALRAKFSEYKLTLVVRPAVADLLRSCPHIDEIIVYDDDKFRRNPLHRIVFLWSIYCRHYSIALYPCYSRTLPGDMLTLWTAAPVRIGWKGSDRRSIEAEGAFSKLTEGGFSPETHELIRNAKFAHALGAVIAEGSNPVVWCDRHAQIEADQNLQGLSVEVGRLIAILPGASFKDKNWGERNYLALICELLNSKAGGACTVIICGEKKDSLPLKHLPHRFFTRVMDLTGKTSLLGLAAILSRCAIAIGNDTGTMHVAIASGIPTVCVLGGGHYGRFMPYGDREKHACITEFRPCFQCNWNCVLTEPECVTKISLERMMIECLKRL